MFDRWLGGNDTVDLSGFTSDQIINLQAPGFSGYLEHATDSTGLPVSIELDVVGCAVCGDAKLH